MQIAHVAYAPKFRAKLVLALILLCEAGFAQNSTSSGRAQLSLENYSRLLDALFPRDYPPTLKLDYLMILRFEPNEGPESQLALRMWHDGRIEATLYRIQGVGAWRAANGYTARTGKVNLGAIARSINVQMTPLSISRSDVEKWHSSLFEAVRNSEAALEGSAEEFRRSGTRETVLDADRYDFWYVQGETEFHWSFSDVRITDAPQGAILPLAKWMSMVRLESIKDQ
jgi:hypothetical protein